MRVVTLRWQVTSSPPPWRKGAHYLPGSFASKSGHRRGELRQGVAAPRYTKNKDSKGHGPVISRNYHKEGKKHGGSASTTWPGNS